MTWWYYQIRALKAVQIKSAHNAKYVSLKTELNDDFIKSMTRYVEATEKQV